MRHKPLTVLFEPKYVVVKASIAGFYKSLGKKFDLCRHIVCGYKRPIDPRCRFAPEEPTSNYHSSWWVTEQNNHKNKGCKNAWCVVEHGAQHEIVDQKVPCQRSYYHLYTEQELASPETKVEYVALSLTVASKYAHHGCVAVYDLLNDKWHNDSWWSTTPKGDLMPCNQSPPDVPPKDIYAIEDVVLKAKEGL